jgi:hypothetical protein
LNYLTTTGKIVVFVFVALLISIVAVALCAVISYSRTQGDVAGLKVSTERLRWRVEHIEMFLGEAFPDTTWRGADTNH